MYYFIPSWYSDKRLWTEKELPWHQMHSVAEFDDSVSQMHMFKQANEDIKMLLFSYSPNLRHFLHRQHISSIAYWSVFDDIQNIRLKSVRQLLWNDFDWPEHIEWVYTPWSILGRLNGSVYTRLDFGQEGHLLSIRLFEEGDSVKTLVFDDRGFLSSIIRAKGTKDVSQTYYDDCGNWRIKEDFLTNEVRINAAFKDDFDKEIYKSMEELIQEKFNLMKAKISAKDVVVLASDKQHDRLVLSAKTPFKLIVSLFGKRTDFTDEKFKNKVSGASLLVCDTEKAAVQLQGIMGENAVPVQVVFPFDMRFIADKSRQTNVWKIYFAIGEEPIDHFRSALMDLFHFMDCNMHVQLVVGASVHSAMSKAQMIEYLQDLIDRQADTNLIVDDETQDMYEPLVNDQPEEHKPRVFVNMHASEDDLIRILDGVRILVDVRETPDLFLQIAGISIGIPQVNQRHTRYVEHLQNGFIVKDISQLTEALQLYLTDLTHWDEVLEYSMQKIEENTGTRLVNQWKAALDNNG